ncbi:hypothetical protein EJB05_41947 [Eragrostis curvula]|uniref:Protein kinase domain-containing protein n=1 Tax=Eragrostis curvula TaxID=38414 RepID=A0A5J9TB62_9POAL|nr:hypothetical protein EJB05_41947 [Eragrostis curvula]
MSCFSRFFKSKRSTQQKEDTSIDDFSGSENITRYSYKELVKATSNFDQANKIGEGGYGPVYKGTLKDGTAVAVKVLSLHSRQGAKEFLNELLAISDVTHKNLVKLYGCCLEGRHRILVYNYLENNSLAQTLVDLDACYDGPLTKLCEEITARLIQIICKTIGTAAIDSGYLAPEYAIRGQVTRKADVYSFGVLLIEIVSGRCNTDMKLPYDDQFLLEKTWRCYDQGHVEKIIDSSLGDDLDVEEACRFLKIGLLCTQDVTKRRPGMTTVVAMLKGEADVGAEKMNKPDVIRDFRDLTLRSKATSSTLLTSIMARSSLVSSSQETTRTSITFTAISERD